jgi:hypothetical protein
MAPPARAPTPQEPGQDRGPPHRLPRHPAGGPRALRRRPAAHPRRDPALPGPPGRRVGHRLWPKGGRLRKAGGLVDLQPTVAADLPGPGLGPELHEGLPARNSRRTAAAARLAPLLRGAGPCPGVPPHRNRHRAPPAAGRDVEVHRELAHRGGDDGPLLGLVPPPLLPEAPPPLRHRRRGPHRAGRPCRGSGPLAPLRARHGLPPAPHPGPPSRGGGRAPPRVGLLAEMVAQLREEVSELRRRPGP